MYVLISFKYFQDKLLQRYQEVVQTLASMLPPVVPSNRGRHDIEDSVMKYMVENGEVVEERTGVYHLVHGWIQQANPSKVSIQDLFCLVVNKLYYCTGAVYFWRLVKNINWYCSYQVVLPSDGDGCENIGCDVQSDLSRSI